MDVIYLDYNASSPLLAELLEELPRLAARSRGNPSSSHQAGRESRRLITDATESVARQLGCAPDSVYWTSGASEANSWVLHSVAAKNPTRGRKTRLIVTATEHESILLAANAALEGEPELARVLSTGEIDLTDLEARLKSGPADLVSIAHANNETGVIQPVEQIAALCRAHDVPLHLDCAQSLGKVPVNLAHLGARYATFSAHKIGGPKGVGFLVAAPGARLSPLVQGKQQRGLRGGTENALGVGLTGRAIDELGRAESRPFPEALARLRDEFERELLAKVPGAVIHGARARRLPNTTFVGFEGVTGDGILMNLDLAGVCASAGSACGSGTARPSHVLVAMGCGPELASSSVRLSSGRGTSSRDYERVLEILPPIVERLRKREL